MNKKPTVPAPSKLNLLRQICNFIPEFLVAKIARETKVDEKARTFSPWSHVVALVYAQLTHSIGLNDVCDALRLQSGPLSSIRGATPPSRNNLSHADKVRPAEMAEKLFWAVFEHLSLLSPDFVGGHGRKRFAGKFKRLIHLVDSTRGERIYETVAGRRRERTSVIAACQNGKLVAPLTFAGTCNTEVVDAYFAQVLLPELPPGSVIVLDNARFHQSPTTAALVTAASCGMLFLPPYSPDLNPIEHLWAAVKTRLRQGLPTTANPALLVGTTCLCYC